MKQITRTLVGIALGCCMAGNAAHASIIKSMTIEEIGIASGGLGTLRFPVWAENSLLLEPPLILVLSVPAALMARS